MVGFATLVIAVLLLPPLDVARAGFSATTDNVGSEVEALAVAPPTGVTGTRTINLFPLPTCDLQLWWTASASTGVTGYEIRAIGSGGTVLAGPWTVGPGATGFTTRIPLLGSTHTWQVRTLLSSWSSPWANGTPQAALLCLL
jgi:hypothetical protein